MSDKKAASKKSSKLQAYNRVGYLMVAPFVIVFLIFSVYPVFRTLQISFSTYKGFGPMTFVGFTNYARVIKDKFFWTALFNTLRIWIPNIILQLGLAFLLTMVFSDVKYRFRGLPFFRAVYYIPNIIAVTSIAFMFTTLLDWQHGSVNVGLHQMFPNYVPIDWLGKKETAPYVVSVISAWQWFGNSFIMLMAGVQGINRDYFEASAIDGANRWVQFAKITMPLLKPIFLYVSITSFIGGLQMFDMPFLMFGDTGAPFGSTMTMIMYLYKYGFVIKPKQVGYAGAIAYVLFILILIVSIIQFKLMNPKED
ncbi:MAG: sugar ABC transporter permease [Lachnospiraceae bacterium]|nr:sugar ABC transporter permease [Lachnospiraceae bacterium]